MKTIYRTCPKCKHRIKIPEYAKKMGLDIQCTYCGKISRWVFKQMFGTKHLMLE